VAITAQVQGGADSDPPGFGRSLFEAMDGGSRQDRNFPKGFPNARRIGVRRSLFTGILRIKTPCKGSLFFMKFVSIRVIRG
jgi:hypothetical protein